MSTREEELASRLVSVMKPFVKKNYNHNPESIFWRVAIMGICKSERISDWKTVAQLIKEKIDESSKTKTS